MEESKMTKRSRGVKRLLSITEMVDLVVSKPS